MISVQLHDVRLHGFHGVYEGEEKTGNEYAVDLAVTYEERFSDFENAQTIISYVELYEIVRQRMSIPTGLLEKLCESIILRIKHQYPFVREIDISLKKLQSPISRMQGTPGVRMVKRFND